MLYSRFQDVFGTNRQLCRKRSFSGNRAFCSGAVSRPRASARWARWSPAYTADTTSDMITICIGSKPRRHRPGSAASPASRLVRRAPGSSPSHQAIPSCEISANALPSPPAGPAKHTAGHHLMRGQPTPGEHRYRDRRSQPPFGAKMCVSNALRHPDRPAGSPDRPGAGRARSDHGAGRRRLVAVRPAHSYWAGAGWCLGPLPAVFLQMSRRPAYSKT